MNTPSGVDEQLEKPTGNPFAVIAWYRDRVRHWCQQQLGQQPKQRDPNLSLPVPWPVLLSLQSSAQLTKREIGSLIEADAWHDEAIYLLIKGFDHDLDQQDAVLTDITTALRQRASAADMRTVLLDHFEQLPDDVLLPGAKISQVSFSGGPDNWQRQAGKVARKMYEKNLVPCLVAYSALSALRSFVQEADNGGRFVIGYKHRMRYNAPASAHVVHCLEDHCTVERWDDDHRNFIPDVALCDDTVRSGATYREMIECLHHLEHSYQYPNVNAPLHSWVNSSATTGKKGSGFHDPWLEEWEAQFRIEQGERNKGDGI